MKKIFLLMIALCVIFTGCSKSSSPVPDVPSRTVTCTRCDGGGVCYHCDGESVRDGRRCRVCDGSGACTACGGQGKLEVLEIDGKDYTVCTGCHGSGACGYCEGAGKMTRNFSTLGRIDSECSFCHGNGKCILCKGSGVRRLSGF